MPVMAIFTGDGSRRLLNVGTAVSRETFGEEYRAYQERVRWKMVPGIY